MFEAFSVSLFRRVAADLRRANRPVAALAAVRLHAIELMIVLAIVGVIAAYATGLPCALRVGERGSRLRRPRGSPSPTTPQAARGLDGGYSPPAGTCNVESVVIDGETGQITVAFTTRVAAAGTNTLVLVPSAPDKADAPTARVPLKGRDAGRRDRVRVLRGRQGRVVAAAPGRAAAARRGDAAREVCAGGCRA